MLKKCDWLVSDPRNPNFRWSLVLDEVLVMHVLSLSIKAKERHRNSLEVGWENPVRLKSHAVVMCMRFNASCPGFQ